MLNFGPDKAMCLCTSPDIAEVFYVHSLTDTYAWAPLLGFPSFLENDSFEPCKTDSSSLVFIVWDNRYITLIDCSKRCKMQDVRTKAG